MSKDLFNEIYSQDSNVEKKITMSEIISISKKKKEKSVKEVTNTVKSFGQYLDMKIQENNHKLLKFSDKLFKALLKLQLNDGFDIEFTDVLDTHIIIAFRCLKITENTIVLVGGYGSTFNIYYIDNIYNNNLSEQEEQKTFTNSEETNKKLLYKKIIMEFFQNYAVKKINKISKKYEVF